MGRLAGEREREKDWRPPSATAYLYRGIVSSSHSSRRSTLPRLMANHHYLITSPFFVGRRRVSVVRRGTSHIVEPYVGSFVLRKFVNLFYEAPRRSPSEFQTRIAA